MHSAHRPLARRRRDGTLESLEGRAMLSGTMPHLDHGLKIAAQVAAVKKATHPIVTSLPATPSSSITTVPANGDVNPYGIAVVPARFPRGGLLSPGQILVSNFNDKANVQGTGTTIVTVTPVRARRRLRSFSRRRAGLTLALGVLQKGYVIVGNVPTTDGTFATGAGSIQIINKSGVVVDTLTATGNMLDGPWASAVVDHGSTAQLFISNVLSGTIDRINLKIVNHHGTQTIDVGSTTEIGSGYLVQPNSAAVVVGPGGLAYDSKNGDLYVAATGNNEIFAIPHATKTNTDIGTGTLVYSDPTHLFGPIGLAVAPDGDLLATNDDAVNTTTEAASQTGAHGVHDDRNLCRPALAVPGSGCGLRLCHPDARQDGHDRLGQRRHQHGGLPVDHDLIEPPSSAHDRHLLIANPSATAQLSRPDAPLRHQLCRRDLTVTANQWLRGPSVCAQLAV